MTKSIMTIGHNDTTLAHQWDPCTRDLHLPELPEGDDNQTILNTATLITLAITLATIRLSIPRHPHQSMTQIT